MKKTFKVINGNVLYLFNNGYEYHVALQMYCEDVPCGCIERLHITTKKELIHTVRFYLKIARDD